MIFELIPSALRMATPLGFAALGGIYSERAGVINLALEGMMLIGAFGYVVGAQGSGSTWIGLLVGISCGMAMALLHAIATVTFQAEQVVTGIGINILALGITEYLLPPPEQVGGLPHWHLPLIGSYSFIVYLLPIDGSESHPSVQNALGLAIACSRRINGSTCGSEFKPDKMAISWDIVKRTLSRNRWMFPCI